MPTTTSPGPEQPTLISASARSSSAATDGASAGKEKPVASPPTAADLQVTKLIVAVHGIGDQYRFATIQSVAQQMAGYCKASMPFPLGEFHGLTGEIRALPFAAPAPYDRTLGGFGFAEVFWADIHRTAQDTHNTIEETKAWAGTMVTRMASLDRDPTERGVEDVDEKSVNYAKTGAVVAEMIETISTLENLCFLAAKAGLFQFNLRDLLDDYIGAVQLVAEFEDYGGQIFGKFAEIMRGLVKRHPNAAEIYIVSHSEGTVVSFYSLLSALSAPQGEDADWVKYVRGLMTIGSPIDKHIVMWPALWARFHEQGGMPWKEAGVKLERPIVWWNYYDYGDPVGFELDTAREWLLDHLWVEKETAGAKVRQPFFEFPKEQDLGFTRYFFPGKAHIDYWTDPAVFFHFFNAVLLRKPASENPVPPPDPWAKIVCCCVPYVLCFLLLLGGTYALYKGLEPLRAESKTETQMAAFAAQLSENASGLSKAAAEITAGAAELSRPVPAVSNDAAPRTITISTVPAGKADPADGVGGSVFGIAMLLAGVTVTSRIPRLTKFGRWYLVPLLVFSAGAFAYLYLVSALVQSDLARPFGFLPGSEPMKVILLSFLIAVASAVISKHRPEWGMKPLMIMGGLASGCIVGFLANGKTSPLWPLLLALAAFVYLWWLAALIFDLVFVWHRYIRSNEMSIILKSIRDRRTGKRALERKRLAASAKP